MSLKAEFLKMASFEELKRNEDRFNDIDLSDKEICDHFNKLIQGVAIKGIEDPVLDSWNEVEHK